MDYLGLFLSSAFPPFLASSPLVCFYNCPEVSVSSPLLPACVALSPFEFHWQRDWAKAAAEIGDGWGAGIPASCCLFWKQINEQWEVFAVTWAELKQSRVRYLGWWDPKMCRLPLWA